MRRLDMPYLFLENSLHDLENKISMAITDIRSGQARNISMHAKENCLNLFSHKAIAERLDKYFHEDGDFGIL